MVPKCKQNQELRDNHVRRFDVPGWLERYLLCTVKMNGWFWRFRWTNETKRYKKKYGAASVVCPTN